jgi:hypothetical protein
MVRLRMMLLAPRAVAVEPDRGEAGVQSARNVSFQRIADVERLLW